ncbi:hypothetical protein BGX23_004049 [Mortierella sp. AD031]|nr:hypothetical protein BGX23_004049 [Mortierella sp. AD031]
MSTAAGSLAHDMLLAFRDQQLSDITVQAFGQTFHLHRLILLRSGYFRSLILGQGDWIEKSRQAITIQFDDPYVTLQSFQRIIHWLYGIDFHYTEGNAPLTFKTTIGTATGHSSNSHTLGGGSQSMARSASAQYHGQSVSSGIDSGRHGLGLNHFIIDHPTYSDKTSITCAGSVSFRHYGNIMLDPSDKIDELLISMYAAASYLNITALMEEICSDIARRIRDNRGLIHYMEYAWRLNNGKAWDIILAQCFYQFFWSTYKSITLQEMLVSPDMPLAGLVNTLISESLWVPNEYERYQLVKGIMLRRLNLETEKLMNWVYDYHEQDWFGILKDLDDNGTWSYELTSDAFLNNIQDWESNSTAEYEDAVDTDLDWASTTKELHRRSSQISTSLHFEEDDDRAATPTAEMVKPFAVAAIQPINPSPLRKQHDNANSEGEAEGQEEEGTSTEQAETPEMTEMKTTPQSPVLDTVMSSPALSALSIASDALPRHQVRELLVFMYILHHSIHYTHMSFDHLHQILTDGMVMPARIKDAFWRQHLLRRIAVSTSATLPYLSAPSITPLGRYHGAGPAYRERRSPLASAISRAKMSGSSRPSPAPSNSLPINSYGLLPIRFSTSLYISRRDLMTDGKHFTASTFYGGSWWSIQVGNNLNSAGQVGVFLSSAPVPRVVPSAGGGRTPGGSNTSRLGTSGIFAALRGDQDGTSSGPMRDRRGGSGGSTQGDHGSTANGDCSSVYSRQRDLGCSYRIYMTSNVVEAPQYFAATASNRLEEIRGSEFGHHHHASSGGPQSSTNDIFRPRAVGLGGVGSSSLPSSPELGSSSFVRTTQKIASEDEMICHDSFKLNEGWGYKKSNYLTRVARQVRDQPPKAARNPANVYPQDSASPQLSRANTNGHPPQHQQQHQQQQQHVNQQGQPQYLLQQQHPLPGDHPLPQIPVHHGGQQQQAPQHQGQGQQQQQQQQQPLPPLPGGHPAQQQQQQQGPHNHPAGNASQPPQPAHYAQGTDETEDDGLWIHFVVKVGWSDRKSTLEKAAS